MSISACQLVVFAYSRPRPSPSCRTRRPSKLVSGGVEYTPARQVDEGLNVTGFIWLEDIVEKLWRKHRVERREVAEVFGEAPHFRLVEKGHRAGENVYAALGQTDGGRYLIVFFVLRRDGRAVILSARDMTDSERRRYGRR